MKTTTLSIIIFLSLNSYASNNGITANCQIIDPSSQEMTEVILPLEQSPSQPEFVERIVRFQLGDQRGFVQVWGRTLDKLWKKLTVKGVRGVATPLEKEHVVRGLSLDCTAEQEE